MENKLIKCTLLGIGCSGLLVLGGAFSGCVPVQPAAETTLNFTVPGARTLLQRWTPSTGKVKTVAKSSGTVGLRLVSSQPKGGALLYVTQLNSGYGPPAYYTINPDDAAPSPKPIAPLSGVQYGNDLPLWAPDGKYLSLVEFSNTDPGVLYVVSPTGARTATGPAKPETYPGHYFERGWSADSRKVFYSEPTPYIRKLHVYDVVSKQDRIVADSTQDSYATYSPHWLADNRHILAYSIDTVSNEIVYVILDGDAQAPATYQEVLRTPGNTPSQTVDVDASATGDRFVVTTTLNNGEKTVALKFADGRTPVTFPNVVKAEWSNTGNYLALTKGGGADLYEIAVADRDGQIIDTVSKASTAESYQGLYWSPSGNALIASYIDATDAAHVLIKTLPSGNWREIYTGADRPIYTPLWSPDEKIVIIASGNNAYLYDARFPNQPATTMNGRYERGTWTSNSKKAALCLPIGELCEPTVLNVTADGYTLTSIPVRANNLLTWSEPQ